MYPLASTIFHAFITAHPGAICTVTLLLIALFFVAWKAPAWVKEVGLIALAFGVMWTFISLVQMAAVLQAMPDEVSPNVIWGGVKVVPIQAIYGLIVYIISLIIRIIKKPRI